MTKAMMLFILAILIMIYGILSKLIDRQVYIQKCKSLEYIFDRLYNRINDFDDKNVAINFLVKIENDINDII